MKKVWALAAMRALDDEGKCVRVPLVGRDETPLLKEVVRDAAVMLAGTLGGYVTALNADADGGVTMSVAACGDESSARLEQLRRVAESAVAVRVMGRLLAGRDAAAEVRYNEDGAGMEAKIRGMLERSGQYAITPVRI